VKKFINFLCALRIAVKTEQWAFIQDIAQTLNNDFYEIRGRFRIPVRVYRQSFFIFFILKTDVVS